MSGVVSSGSEQEPVLIHCKESMWSIKFELFLGLVNKYSLLQTTLSCA